MTSLQIIFGLGLLGLCSSAPIDATSGESYPLNRALKVGDIISAWGIYVDDTTEKFNVNIIGDDVNILHVDFRPFIDTIVLNNNVNGAWQAEVRPAFGRDTFVSGEVFKVTIEVLDSEYKISFNDEEIAAKFPQRDDIALANAVALRGGSNGFQWTKIELPADGGWSDFSDWSECPVACGGGSQSRSRSCSNPAPANGGADCDGDDSESQDCNVDPCPVDGGWSDFSDWSECSAACNGGSQSRSRSCSNPAPANGGADCDGDDSESQDCNADPCLAVGGQRYDLARPLAVGDIIEAWGIYKDITTVKFNVNILGDEINLLHVDFRPYIDTIVLNNNVNGVWVSEVRPAFSKDNFGADEMFKVSIEVLDGEYKISFNDEEIAARFPQRDDIALANAVALFGGSNGFQWTNLNLPKALEAVAF